ncbi:MAG: hypothetical protein HC877_04785 [Thioploca sp.]|nr:hypothetical protein [Thioploca sp.]
MIKRTKPVTQLNYCQYRLWSQVYYTWTHFAAHLAPPFSHNVIHSNGESQQIPSRMMKDRVRYYLALSSKG